MSGMDNALPLAKKTVVTSWDLRYLLAGKVRMRPNNLLRQSSDPLVEKDFLKLGGNKHLKEDQIFVAGVFDVVTAMFDTKPTSLS